MIPILVIFIILLLVWFGLPVLLKWGARRYIRNKQEQFYENMRRSASDPRGAGDPFASFFSQFYYGDPAGDAPGPRKRKIDPSEAEDVSFVEIKDTVSYSATSEPKQFRREEQVSDTEWEDL